MFEAKMIFRYRNRRMSKGLRFETGKFNRRNTKLRIKSATIWIIYLEGRKIYLLPIRQFSWRNWIDIISKWKNDRLRWTELFWFLPKNLRLSFNKVDWVELRILRMFRIEFEKSKIKNRRLGLVSTVPWSHF